jgi:negative regulator of flagellin synthesis FlgM
LALKKIGDPTMQISGPAQLHGAQGISAPHTVRNAPTLNSPRGIDTQDTLELSSAGLYAEQIQDLPEIRSERVAALREQIAAGTYETDDKLNSALDRLLDELV